jgi:ATPase subunit of ABC transporter with duplicated ATPase domains
MNKEIEVTERLLNNSLKYHFHCNSTMISNSIRVILERHALDAETMDYLESFLQDAAADMEENGIVEMLEQFVSDSDDCEKIVSLIKSQQQKQQQQKKQEIPLTTGRSITNITPPTLPSTVPQNGNPFVVALQESDEKSHSLKSHKELRKEKRKKSKLQNRTLQQQPDSVSGSDNSKQQDHDIPADLDADLLELNDHASAWQDTRATGQLWGGRGKGGRGVRYTDGDQRDTLYLPDVTLQFQHRLLLEDTSISLVKGHRYGVLGRNGVGKSVLFRALAKHYIPGLPHSYRILLVNQQLPGSDETPLQVVLQADVEREENRRQQVQIETELEQGVDVTENAEKLEQLMLDWDAMDGDGAENRAVSILKGLGFSKSMIHETSTSNLSGGWRMRLSLARALFLQRTIDLLLLDEVSNHLDLHGMLWLQDYLGSKCNDLTMMIVSHDRDFLGAVTTDMMVMNHQKLTYHPGNYWEYVRQMEERTAMQSNKLEAAEKQLQKALEFVQKNQASSKKGVDPNKQRQAKMVKDKKLDRIGMFREDGHKFKNFSLKQMDAKSVRLGEHVHIEADERVVPMKFPDPSWPPSLNDAKSPLITLDNVSFRYSAGGDGDLLHDLTLQIDRGSKIALVGKNGSGKSTLVKLITGELGGGSDESKTLGKIWRHANVRIGHVSQYSVEELEQYGGMTVVEYAKEYLSIKTASAKAVAAATGRGYGGGNIRQYLGAFGLGSDKYAHRQIKTLSGGERMRLCFCTVMADEPHVLVLDESSNHLDLETLDSLAEALKEFQGAVLMVSHNQGFLRIFANTLWICESGQVQALYSDAEGLTNSTFDDLFSEYRSHVMGGASRSNARRTQAEMAKRAGKQSSGATSRTALLA